MKRSEPFTIFYRDGYAWLTVFPVSPGGHPVYPEEILGRLKLLGIPQIRRQQLYTLIDKASGIPEKLVPWPEGEQRGPRVILKISEDAMSAIMTIKEGKSGGEPLTVDFLSAKLRNEGIVFGIKENNLRIAVKEKLFGQPLVAAEGTFPVHEISAQPEYFFETDRGKPFKELEYNRIDLRELNFIQNKRRGDLLAALKNPVNPVNGRDIFGNSIPAEKDSQKGNLKAGKGTELTSGGKEVRALIDGNVKRAGTVVMVEPLVTVENVDYSNGNMDFNGAIDIKGRVADGFTVKAEGDIQIGKSVSKVHITSGGDMILKAGISGNGGGILICGGDLYARYIENADVRCEGNLYVEEAIMHSMVKVKGDIILAGKRAEIFGGKIVAGGSVICKKLGNINEPPTEIHIGTLPESYDTLFRLEYEIKKITAQLDDLELKIRQIKKSMGRNNTDTATAAKLPLAEKQLETEYSALNDFYTEKVKELHELKRHIQIKKDAILRVEQNIFGKVSVYFGIHKWLSSGKGTVKTVLSIKDGIITEK